MNIKLTLSMDKQVIERAKRFAERENKSLSRIVEDYFSKLSDDGKYEIRISPLVKRLSGVVPEQKGGDLKKAYADHLAEKYK